jgi:hypothetical protein
MPNRHVQAAREHAKKKKKNLTQSRKGKTEIWKEGAMQSRLLGSGFWKGCAFTFHFSPITFHVLLFAPLRLCVSFSLSVLSVALAP